jgi:ATP-dependent DNA ligase
LLPPFPPSPLTSVKKPIGHPNRIYELQHDGFRGILSVDREQAWLVSRKGKKLHQFDPLLKQVPRSLNGQHVILDGEIVVLDKKGRSNFFDLMAHRGESRQPITLTIPYDVTHDSLSLSTRKALAKKLCSFQDVVGSCAFTKIVGQVAPAHHA